MSEQGGIDRRGLARLARSLPEGARLYLHDPSGEMLLADRDGARALGREGELARFIDDGQFAHYLVGDAGTSPERPSNATYKLGLIAPHSAFTPHAHRGEHVVLSLGYASCGLYDTAGGRFTDVPLTPGMMIRIPGMMPHSFANRGPRPLTILAANTGYGIDHEDYAITADDAELRALAEPLARHGRTVTRSAVDWATLASALRSVERAQRRGPGPLAARERLAARLRRLATALERPR